MLFLQVWWAGSKGLLGWAMVLPMTALEVVESAARREGRGGRRIKNCFLLSMLRHLKGSVGCREHVDACFPCCHASDTQDCTSGCVNMQTAASPQCAPVNTLLSLLVLVCLAFSYCFRIFCMDVFCNSACSCERVSLLSPAFH